MKKKVVITLIIIIASVAGLFNSIVTSANKPKDFVKVYYFHGNYRCQTCTTIESYIKESVKDNFKEEIKSGLVQLQIINFDKKHNKKFIDKYKLYNQTLIISRFSNNKEVEWKDCPKIWETVGNKGKFYSYVKNEVDKYLKAK